MTFEVFFPHSGREIQQFLVARIYRWANKRGMRCQKVKLSRPAVATVEVKP